MRAARADHAHHAAGLVLVTGATGLLGGEVVRRWAALRPAPRLAVLVRDADRWRRAAERLGLPRDAAVVLVGDVTREGLGLDADARRRLAREASAVVHLAADTTFSRPLAEARAANTLGTAHVLQAAAEWPHVDRVAFVSTAFVAGRRTGRVPEHADGAATPEIGWVNAYEQSKAEAERLVWEARPDAVVLRSSTVACDDATGRVTQRNAVHRALRLFHDGLAAMMPGVEDSALDVVTADYVADAVARLALRESVAGETLHLCAGAGALPLGELLDDTYARWARSLEWRRRAVARPALGDLRVWELFARTVEETGHPRLRQVTRALSHFLPQLALTKRFETARADALLGCPAPPVRSYWGAMIDHLAATGWRGVAGLAEVAA